MKLKPGELLFVPGGLPHTVENLTPTMAISTNYVDASNMDRLVDSISRDWKEVMDDNLQVISVATLIMTLILSPDLTIQKPNPSDHSEA